MNLKKAAKRGIALGVASVLAVGVSHLALTDIYHAEGDLTLEWNVVRGCFAVILAFQIFQIYALVTLGRIARGVPRREGPDA